VIDGFLTEINVTSPTGLRAIQRLGGANLAAAIWDVIEAKRRRFGASSPDRTA
jgi:glutathione synthase